MRDVVADGEAEDVRHGGGGGDVEGGAGDDGDELAFVVDLGGRLRREGDGDGGCGAGEGGGGFVEEDGGGGEG